MYRVFVDGKLLCDSRSDDLAIIDPVVTLEANAAGAFEFTLPPKHPRYNIINRLTSIISVYRDEDTEPLFQGICAEETIDFFKQKHVTCEGELTYLNDSILRPRHYSSVSVLSLLTAYITEHNNQVESRKRFEVGSVNVTGNATCFTNMNPTMQEIKEDLIDDFGGYIRIRYANHKKYIDYLDAPTHDAPQPIELGKNLTDYNSNISSLEIATRVIPLGAIEEEQSISGLDTRLTIASVNGGLDYLENSTAVANYGVITKVVIFDDVTTPSALKAKGQAYLDAIQFENVVIEASAIDFGYLSSEISKFKILDNVHVISPTHGMNRWFTLTRMTINLNNPENDVFTLGKEEKLSLTAKTNQMNEEIVAKINEMPSSSMVQQAIDNATALITGNEGGYVVLNTDQDGKPFEILIMNTSDITTATKVWRWNSSGFGYSDTGYEGPYDTAITMDGAIIADMITAGTLRGRAIEGGTITGTSVTGSSIDNGNGTFTVDSLGRVEAKNIKILGGSINMTTDYSQNNVVNLRYLQDGNKIYEDELSAKSIDLKYSLLSNLYAELKATTSGITITDHVDNITSKLEYDALTTPEVNTGVLKLNGQTVYTQNGYLYTSLPVVTQTTETQTVTINAAGQTLRGTHTFQTNHHYLAGETIDVNFTVDSGQTVTGSASVNKQTVSGINNYSQGNFLRV